MGRASPAFTRSEEIKLFGLVGACAIAVCGFVFGFLYGAAWMVGFI
jgi:hypothetical protein